VKGYGQFCPLALASEIVGERWTPLVVRELMLGARRFNDIHRGVPRMSPTLLSRRLKTLEKAGIIARRRAEGRFEYTLTEAGSELVPAIEALALWGKRWLPATLGIGTADPDLILWDMHRRMATDRLPPSRTVIRFDLTDQPEAKRLRWLVCAGDAVDYCIVDPGFEVDLYVTSDTPTVCWVWFGDMPLRRALDDGLIALDGPRALRDAFPAWLRLSPMAEVPRRITAKTPAHG
jgi:DNA-binding HxlR family transcriptional regulator